MSSSQRRRPWGNRLPSSGRVVRLPRQSNISPSAATTSNISPSVATTSNDNAPLAPSPLERLPEDLVYLIGTYLKLGDLKALRTTCKAMDQHLESNPNLKASFKEIKCDPTRAGFAALSRFKERCLANAVESLIWLKPESIPLLDEELARHRRLQRWGLVPKLEALGLQNKEKALAPPPEISEADLQRLMAQIIVGFVNLRAVSLTFVQDDLEEATCRSVPNRRSLPDHRSIPDRNVFEFWAGMVLEIKRPLDVVVLSETGSFGVCWTGDPNSPGKFFFKTSLSFEALKDHEEPWWVEFWLRERFAAVFEVQKTALCHRLRSLELHRTILRAENIDYICSVCNLEELKIWESAIYSGSPNFTPLTRKNGRFGKTVRSLTLLDCTLQPRDPEGIEKLFTDLRDQCRLEQLRFERVGGLEFDWQHEGVRDKGEHLPQIIDSCGIKAALTKMSRCFVISEQPSTRFSEVTHDWNFHIVLSSPIHSSWASDT
ncbi:hypothetical protein HDK64DRAFT_256590 [Phyllosticta capitalensis]